MGLLDILTAPIGEVDVSKYTLDAYRNIVVYKTAFYSFYLPVACGMVLAGVDDPAAFEKAKSICIQMGEYFQVQDDYLDNYGAPEVIGKIGTDIEDNKCSWLICQALQGDPRAEGRHHGKLRTEGRGLRAEDQGTVQRARARGALQVLRAELVRE